MKLKDLLNIEKAIELKQQELEKLREEVEMFELMIDINNQLYSKDEYVNISHVYLYQEEGSEIIPFVECQREKMSTKIFIRDVFTFDTIKICDYLNFYDASHGRDEFLRLEHIKNKFPEVNAYPNQLVPKLLLQKLYYQVNHIDSKVLKRAMMKD